ncbi:hypothetical protein LB507_004810 [Fusarium sp. FIESC RH6]|nr:hypothetical protein LB507_004810 [Fusarium sp. FIESC RH6]
MDQLANQVQNDDSPGDLAKVVQEASASPSPTASDMPQKPDSSGSPGSNNDNKSGGGIGESGKDDSNEVVSFGESLFEKGQVFVVADNQQERMVNFIYNETTTTLEKVVWQVFVDRSIKTLGSNTTSGSSKREMNQFHDATKSSIMLDFTGETSKYYNNTMQIQVDWTKDDGYQGYTKSVLFTVTDNTGNVSKLQEGLDEEQKGQELPETTTFSPGPSSTSGSTSSTSSVGSSDSSGGGGGLSTGATAGIAVGAVLGGLLLIGALVWFLLRRRRRSKQPSEEYITQQTYAVDKETHGRSSDSPNSPYSDEHHMQPIAVSNVDRGISSTPPPGRSSMGSHDRGANSGVQTPQGMSSNVAHLVEDGMTAEEIRRLEEEERQLDDEIERAARR